MISITRARRALLATLVATGVALVPALTASAHVSVSSPDAAPGGFGKVVFRVPSESETANTTAVTVNLPTDTPFPFLNAGAIPGWTITTTKTPLPEPIEVEGFTVTEAVSSVTWTADGDGLAPETFAEFQLSVGPFPEGVDELVFTAVQTYSDGEVVNWSDPTPESGEEPEHPAPVLSLTGESDDHHSGEAADEDSSSSDTLARTLGIVGIVLGAAGLAFGVSARRKPKAPTA